MDLKPFIRDIPDFPKRGVLFRDITPLLRDGRALRTCVERLADHCKGLTIDALAGIESRGFLFGTALAIQLGLGVIPIRKPGKLPHSVLRESYELEYGTDSVEMHADAIHGGQRILLVDDLLATGGTMSAACRLVQKAGGVVVSTLFVIELSYLRGRDRLHPNPVRSLLVYGGEQPENLAP